jgi:hypothetical protein
VRTISRVNGRKSRSANENLFAEERIIYNKARLFIEESIFYNNPFPVSHDIETLRAEAWERAMKSTNLFAKRSAEADKQVSFPLSLYCAYVFY